MTTSVPSSEHLAGGLMTLHSHQAPFGGLHGHHMSSAFNQLKQHVKRNSQDMDVKTRAESDSEIDVDDHDEVSDNERGKKRKHSRSPASSPSVGHPQPPASLSSSFFINDILSKNSAAAPVHPSDLAFLRSTTDATSHLSPPSTPPGSQLGMTPGGFPGLHGANPYSLFAALAAQAQGKGPAGLGGMGGDPFATFAALHASAGAVGAAAAAAAAGGPGGNPFMNHPAMMRPPFGFPDPASLGALAAGGPLPGHLTGHGAGVDVDSDGEPTEDAADDDGCSSTEGGDDDSKSNGKFFSFSLIIIISVAIYFDCLFFSSFFSLPLFV